MQIWPYILIFFCLSTLTQCIHPKLNSSSMENSLPAGVVLPEWISEDCTKKNGYFYFVGYGEGSNASSAARNALLGSRQNALICLFGGTITSTVSIRETNEKATYDSATDLKIDYSFVNWAGYDAVAGKTFYIDSSHSKIYIQYKWNETEIAKEKTRLDTLAKKVEETNAMKQEISLKENVIKEQKERLAELQRQEGELARLKEASDRAAATLTNMRNAHNQKETDMHKIIANLYCGVTVEKLIEIFREPDEIESIGTGDGFYQFIAFRWDQFVVKSKVSSDMLRKLGVKTYAKVGESDDIIVPAAKKQIIEWIFIDYAKTDRGYAICKAPSS